MSDSNDPSVGIVVIGRNEGERLGRCLASVHRWVSRTVYADSGSSDGSLKLAASAGADVVALDPGRPFTAARARNAGFARLLERWPDVEFVQFVDGDCEMDGDWIAAAATFLSEHSGAGCVCGRLRERFPERSIYNRACDSEWNRPTGEVDACGGIAMMRAGAFSRLGGFDDALLAGEEPELCRRMRGAGYSIWRVPQAMAVHDAAMYRFGQWWKRSTRTGFGYAHGFRIAGVDVGRKGLRQMLSSWFWAGCLPFVMLGLAVGFGPSWLGLAAVYPVQVLRMARNFQGPPSVRVANAFLLVLGRFAELQGQLIFWKQAVGSSLHDASERFSYKDRAGKSRG